MYSVHHQPLSLCLHMITSLGVNKNIPMFYWINVISLYGGAGPRPYFWKYLTWSNPGPQYLTWANPRPNQNIWPPFRGGGPGHGTNAKAPYRYTLYTPNHSHWSCCYVCISLPHWGRRFLLNIFRFFIWRRRTQTILLKIFDLVQSWPTIFDLGQS